jgi:hypothetical protein
MASPEALAVDDNEPNESTNDTSNSVSRVKKEIIQNVQ